MHTEEELDIQSEWMFVAFMAHLLTQGRKLGSPISVSLPAALPSSLTATPGEIFTLT